jgi:Uma2 family endonuclease
MKAVKDPDLISIEDYLAGELESPVKHEFLGGTVHAMAGGSNDHNDIAGNSFVSLHNQLRGTPCRPSNSDTKVRVDFKGVTNFYYPDGLVSCERNPGNEGYQDKPILLIEVLSPSSRRIDQIEKLTAYTTIPSLHYYLIIDQGKIAVTLHRRNSDLSFSPEYYAALSDEIQLPKLKATLVLQDLYEGIEFPPS